MSGMQPVSPAQAYEDYFVPAIFTPWTPVLLAHAGPRAGERVLDLACGTGIVARTVAAALGPDGRIVGADISPAMLEVARRIDLPAGTTIEWVECDACSLPDDPFDLILCQQGLQFFPDPSAAVLEMKRVLAPGGRAAVSVWERFEHQPVYGPFFEAQARHLGLPTEEVAKPFAFGGAGRLQRLFMEAGFRRVEVLSETRNVSFPSADDFVARTTLAASAVFTELADMSDEERRAMIAAVTAAIRPTLAEYVTDGRLVFPTHTNIAIARV